MSLNDLTYQVIGCAMGIHSKLGPGLLESVYHRCIEHDLAKLGIPFQSEVMLPVKYDELDIPNGFKADLIVAGKVIVELKSTEKISEIHKSQLLTYLKMSGISLGLLINFREPQLKNGIYRIVNDLNETSAPSADSLRSLRDVTEGKRHA